MLKALLGRAFGREEPPPKATGKALDGGVVVTRLEAARRCALALARRGLLARVYAPRGEVGRVAVPFGKGPAIALGWLELPLNGDVLFNEDGSAIAAQLAPLVRSSIAAAFQGVRVRAVKPDARTWTVRSYRVLQAAIGLWHVIGPDGVVRAAANTPEEAVAVAQTAPWETAAAAHPDLAMPRMEPDYAARWLAALLTEHGMLARALGNGLLAVDRTHGITSHARIATMGVTFDAGFPEAARARIEAGLRAVRLVERLG